MTDITQIQRRRIEAEVLAETYRPLSRSMSPEAACAIIAETTAAAARKAGRAFARSAPHGPDLAHFSGVVDVWSAGNALDIADPRLEADAFSLDVVRCEYARLYLEEMALPPELAYALSCARDGAFAEGYSPHLELTRSRTIAQGEAVCRFRYRWR